MRVWNALLLWVAVTAWTGRPTAAQERAAAPSCPAERPRPTSDFDSADAPALLGRHNVALVVTSGHGRGQTHAARLYLRMADSLWRFNDPVYWIRSSAEESVLRARLGRADLGWDSIIGWRPARDRPLVGAAVLQYAGAQSPQIISSELADASEPSIWLEGRHLILGGLRPKQARGHDAVYSHTADGPTFPLLQIEWFADAEFGGTWMMSASNVHWLEGRPSGHFCAWRIQ